MRESIDTMPIKSALRASLFAIASALALANCSTTPPESDDWPDQELPGASALGLDDINRGILGSRTGTVNPNE